jgi:ATP-dependent protease ClpP protease subunit
MKGLMALILCLGLSWSAWGKQREVIELNGRNTVLLETEITDLTMDTFAYAVMGKRLMLPPDQTLYILIVSGGGDYYTSLKVKKLFEDVPNVAVICKYCASAAGMLFATHKGPRLAIDKSVMLMHEMYLRHATVKDVMNLNEMKQFVINSEDFNEMHYSIIGISREEYEKKIVGKEWTVEGEELVKLHLADKLVTIHCDEYWKSIAPDTCSPKDK